MRLHIWRSIKVYEKRDEIIPGKNKKSNGQQKSPDHSGDIAINGLVSTGI
jgi:hypothetical protein